MYLVKLKSNGNALAEYALPLSLVVLATVVAVQVVNDGVPEWVSRGLGGSREGDQISLDNTVAGGAVSNGGGFALLPKTSGQMPIIDMEQYETDLLGFEGAGLLAGGELPPDNPCFAVGVCRTHRDTTERPTVEQALKALAAEQQRAIDEEIRRQQAAAAAAAGQNELAEIDNLADELKAAEEGDSKAAVARAKAALKSALAAVNPSRRLPESTAALSRAAKAVTRASRNESSVAWASADAGSLGVKNPRNAVGAWSFDRAYRLGRTTGYPPADIVASASSYSGLPAAYVPPSTATYNRIRSRNSIATIGHQYGVAL